MPKKQQKYAGKYGKVVTTNQIDISSGKCQQIQLVIKTKSWNLWLLFYFLRFYSAPSWIHWIVIIDGCCLPVTVCKNTEQLFSFFCHCSVHTHLRFCLLVVCIRVYCFFIWRNFQSLMALTEKKCSSLGDNKVSGSN